MSATRPLRIAVFASGSGSNFQAVADAIRAGGINATIDLLVSDKPSAYAIERATQLNIPTYVFRPKEFASREAYEEQIVAKLRERDIDLVILAGYMRLVTNVLVEPYYGRMINVHPALLPAFPGLDGIGQALAYGAKITGATVHFVDGGTDTGPIIAQRAVDVRDGDTHETLGKRIQQAEHAMLPEVVKWIEEGRVTLDGRIVTVRQD